MQRVSATILALGFLALLALAIPTQPQQYPSKPVERIKATARAQTVAGNGDALMLYFRSVDDVDEGTTLNCPSGWTEALDGYGPHYIGLLSYDWFYGGSGGTGGGFPDDGLPPIIPSGPPTPGTPQTPGGQNPGGPTTGPGGGQSGGGDPGHGGPPPDTEPPGGVVTPGGGFYPGEDPDKPDDWLPAGQTPPEHMPFFDSLIKKAFAQPASTDYYINALGFGSDSVCSQTNLVLVNTKQAYQNAWYQAPPLYSDACTIDPNTGQVICNRCKVCVK